ncbi:hypothetical protein ACFYWP_42340 [Actinacidiphila glaucinigra]|uniref:hypothetical protein n=1 Tax=Actinacidiphila glaucinigra TaxID=235986 RepID=UPI0036A70171
MQLVHAHLECHVPDAEPPSDLAPLVREHAVPERAVEHLVLHAEPRVEPMVVAHVPAR